eukprot:symbB.v1.2.029506.t1/scaffold3240.1/size60461/1
MVGMAQYLVRLDRDTCCSAYCCAKSQGRSSGSVVGVQSVPTSLLFPGMSAMDLFAISPPVPNVVGAILWSPCVLTLSCTLKSAPPLLAEKPSELLPSLQHMPHEEGRKRFLYWGSILLLSPPLMGIICEMIRILACRFKARKKPGGFQRVATVPTVATDLETGIAESRSIANPFLKHRWLATAGIVLYHVFCAGLVGLAVVNEWLVYNGAGLAWELWVVWQHALLLMMVGQTIARCVVFDAEALKQSTLQHVCLCSVPMMSEMADTMKDWIVTGTCLLVTPSKQGFIIGIAMVMFDLLILLAAKTSLLPIRITKELSMCPPLLILQTVSLVPLLLLLASVVLASAMMAILVPLLLLFVGILTSLVWLMPWCDISVHGHCKMKWPLDLSMAALTQCQTFPAMLLINGPSWALNLLQRWISFVADGGCLFVLSSFVIVFSYMLISMDMECTEDMQRTYMGILAMDLKSRSEEGAMNSEGILKKARNFAADFFSSSRLLISWGEDWPQGIIGCIFVYKYMNGLGFAGFSACVSFLKGVAIPLGQKIMCREREHAVRIALKSLFLSDEVDTDWFANKYAQELSESTDKYAMSEVRPKLREILDNASRDIMYGLNVREKFLFDHIWEMRKRILEEGIRKIEEAVQQQLVKIYHKKGISAKELRAQGYSVIIFRGAGLLKTVKECIQTGFVANDCARAGFSIEECLDEGLDVGTAANYKRVKAGYSAKDAGFSAKDLKDAGFSAAEMKKNGYSAKDVKDAGFSAAEIMKVGYSAKDAGFSAKDLKDAGFSAKQMRKNGYSAKDVKDAGFSAKDFQDAGFSAAEMKKAGIEW